MHGNEVTGSNSLFHIINAFRKYSRKNDYLKRIIKYTRLIIIPTINVTGYAEQIREEIIDNEHQIDPNRDFPFDLENNRSPSLQTTTAQLLDEIFKDNVIIGTITFHGGENSITYPWGNYAHSKQPKTGD